MAVSEKKRVSNDRYNSKCDYISIRPIKAIGERIRKAAADSGKSLQGFILDAVDRQISAEQDGEEIPQSVITNLTTWLEGHGHSDAEIVECIAAICKTGE